MNKQSKMLLLSCLFILAIVVVVFTSRVWAAKYFGDGTLPNGSGGWAEPPASAGPSDPNYNWFCGAMCHAMSSAQFRKDVTCLECHGSGINTDPMCLSNPVCAHTPGANAYTCQQRPVDAAYCDKSSYLMTGHKNMLRKVVPGSPWKGADGRVYDTIDPYGSGSVFDWSAGTVLAAGAQPPKALFYLFGGWMFPDTLNSIYDGGFTGKLSDGGSYQCARCHTTGYRFDATGPLPVETDAQLSRIPASGSSLTSSWYSDGIQCERCHRDAANDAGGHVCYDPNGNHLAAYDGNWYACSWNGLMYGGGNTMKVAKPTMETATALCIECHRQESVDSGGNMVLSTELAVSDRGSCSDGVSLNYAACVAGAGTWNYAPFFQSSTGQEFLNSPHARFSGTMAQKAQNSPDLSVSMTGTYNSDFKDPSTGKNRGCTGCHDPHQSVVQAAGSPKPFVNECNDCHTISATRHVTGQGTPFPTGTSADVPHACETCHMFNSYHLFRINVDPNYSTFPAASQLYAGQTTANKTSDGKIAGAVWADLDLVCGQCHVGNGGSGITTPQNGAPNFDRVTLLRYAACIHGNSLVNTVTAAADANGSISPSGTISLDNNTGQTFTIRPDAGYQVSNVLVDGASRGQITTYTLATATGCHTIIAYFNAVTYTITATAGAGGSISPPGTSTFNVGASQTYTVTPATGYHIADVLVDGVSQGPVTTSVFDSINANHTISATFAENPSYAITASAGANGTISPAGNVSVLGGAAQKFTVMPAAGYRVADVLVDGASVGALTSYTFYNVQAVHTVSASFVLDVYTIAAAADANGSITPSGTVTVNPGDSGYFSITPNPGYQVSGVIVDGAQKGAITGYTFTNVSANHAINAYFKVMTFTITASATSGGSISPAATIIVNYGVNQTYTITPAAGYYTVDVQVDGVSQGAVATYTFMNVAANHTIAATFAANPSYTITASVGPNGAISPTGSVSVLSGAYKKFTFMPAAGYRVADVLVDGASVGAMNSYTFNSVTSDHTISASFTLDVYAVTATADVNGSITPAGVTAVNKGSSQTFAITPDAGYQVRSVIVDGANKGSITSYTFTNITANHTINAYFKIK